MKPAEEISTGLFNLQDNCNLSNIEIIILTPIISIWSHERQLHLIQTWNSNSKGYLFLDGEKSCDRTFLAINPCIKWCSALENRPTLNEELEMCIKWEFPALNHVCTFLLQILWIRYHKSFGFQIFPL